MLRSRLTILGAGLTLAASALWGQAQGGNTSDNSSGNTNNRSGTGAGSQQQNQGNLGNTNNRNDPFGQQSRQLDPFANQMRPLYLHGRVVTDNGQPPAEPVVVQRICQSNRIPEGYTDTKGRFSFQVCGDMSLLTTDASASGAGIGQGPMMRGGSGAGCPGVRQIGIGRYDMSSCVLRAELSGYRSDDVQLGMYSSMDNNDVGLIVLHRLDGLVGNVVSALTLAAPKPAQKAYQSGLREMRKKKPNYKKGVTQFEKAVATYPEFAAAWAAMGDAKLGLQDEEGARIAFEKAIEADPKYLKPYEPLIEMAVEQEDWEGMRALGPAYLELNPNASNIRFLTAVAALNSGNPEEAEEMVLAMRVQEGDSVFPQTYQIMALVHEGRAEFEKAAEQYRAFISAAREPDSQNVQQVERKLFEWEALGVIQSNEQ